MTSLDSQLHQLSQDNKESMSDRKATKRGESDSSDSLPALSSSQRNKLMRSEEAREEFLLQLAESLHRYGTPSHELEEALQVCAERLDLQAAFFSTPTAIFVSFPQSQLNRTVLKRVNPGGFDLEKLVAVHELTSDFLNDGCEIDQAIHQLREIDVQQGYFSGWLTTLGYSIASGSVVCFLGGGLREIVITAVIGAMVGWMEAFVRTREAFARAFPAVAAITASSLAVVASCFLPGLSSEIVTLGSLIVLIPGLTLTLSVSELARQHLASGTSRLMGAVLQFLILGFGVAFGRSLFLKLLDPVSAVVVPPQTWLYVVCVLLAPISFAVLFRTRTTDVGIVFVGCMVGLAAGYIGSDLLGREVGVAIGSFAMAVFSNLVSRILQQPAAITLVPGLMFLVPGSIGFLSLQSFVEKDPINGVQSAFSVLFIASALVSGLLLADFLVQPRRWVSSQQL